MKKLSNRTIGDIVLVAVTVMVWLVWLATSASVASASVDTGRPDACRTYNVNFTFKGIENEDHKACGPADYNKPAKEDKPADTVVPVVPVVPVVTDDTPVITEDKPADNDTPVVTDDTPADTDGNPGNDKPVGNAGEKCDKSMCENSDGKSGEHGKSSND